MRLWIKLTIKNGMKLKQMIPGQFLKLWVNLLKDMKS